MGDDDVRGNRRAHDKGAHGARTVDDEDQSGRPARAEVLRVDRWIYSLLAEHLPADVDLEGGIRRVGPDHRAQEVLLRLRRVCAEFLPHSEFMVPRCIKSLGKDWASKCWMQVTVTCNAHGHPVEK